MATEGRIEPLPEEYPASRGRRTADAVVVAGMHRSGTSALTRILNLLGLDLPKTLYAARPDNPLGYWEPQAVIDAHDAFLAEIGSSFDDVFPLPDSVLASGKARALEDRLVEILQEEYASSRQFVVKDPRICRLVPVWMSALERFGAEPRFVLTVRNPLEVAASLKVRNEYSDTKSLLLWLRHVLEAERHTREQPRTVVSYENLLRDWHSTLDRIGYELGIAWPRASHLAHAEIEEFLSPRRRHHAFEPLEAESRPDVVDWVKRTYRALLAAAAGEPLAEDVLDGVRAELDRADLVYGPLLAESRLALATRTKALEEQAAARKSAEAELASRREAITALEPELEIARRDADTLREQFAQLRMAEAARASELDKGRAELEQLRSDLAARDDALTARETEAQAARAELEGLNGELAARTEVLNGHAAELQVVREELRRVGADFAASSKTLAQREAELEQARAELERLGSESSSREAALSTREAELAQTRTELERLSAEGLSLERALSAREAELAQTQMELKRLTAQESSREETLSAQAAELAQTRAERDSLAAEGSSRGQRLSAQDAELGQTREELERLRADAAAHAGAVSARESDLRQARTELAAREQALSERSSEAAQLDRRLREVEAELAERSDELGFAWLEFDRAAGDARELTVRFADAEAARDELAEALVERDAALASASAELDQVGTEAERIAAEHAASMERVVELTREFETSSRAMAALEEELGRVRAELADRTRTTAERDAEAESLRTDVERLGRALAVRDAEVGERDSLITDLHRDVESLRDQLASRISEMERAAAEGEAQRSQMETHLETIVALRAVVEEQGCQIEQQARRIEAQSQQVEELSRRWWRRSKAARDSASVPAKRTRGSRPTGSTHRRLRGRWRSFSQLASWLLHGGSGGMQNVRTYRELRRSATFDARYYLSRYPDVAESGLDPLMHYVEHGAREGRMPSAGSNTPSKLADDANTSAVDAFVAEPVAAAAPAPEPVAPPEPVVATPPVTGPIAAIPEPTVSPVRAAYSPLAARTHAASNGPLNGRPPPQPTPAAQGPIEPTDLGDITIILSRQRSGTNAIRSILETHPDVFCFNEVFNFADKDSENELLRESNFFTFLERYANGDVSRTFPDNHERLFLDFIEYLRCLAPKPNIVVDVKYNTTHFLTQQWPVEIGASYLFELLAKHGARVFNVTRKNYLRYVLSTDKAWYSDRYTIDREDTTYRDTARWLDPDYVVSELERCRREDDVVERAFGSHPRLLTRDYADIFPGGDDPVAPGFLDEVAAWLGVANQFRADPIYRKQSTLPLDETLENYAEIAAVLRATEFACCLDDEPSYRRNGSGRSHEVREPSAAVEWSAVIGSDPDQFCDQLSRARPDWVKGSIDFDDVRFLFRQALEHGRDLTIEIGTASGMSTAVLAHAAQFRRAAGTGGANWRVLSYDIQPQIYFDESRRVGDAARELLPKPLLERVEFAHPAKAVDIADRHGPDEIEFMFVDANHKHPWPALDLLATLGVLAPGAVIVLHDINLPLLHPEFGGSGVNFLFNGLDVEKETPPIELPNVGSVRVPHDKGSLRRQLLEIVVAHEWEVAVPEHVTTRLLPRAAVKQPARN